MSRSDVSVRRVEREDAVVVRDEQRRVVVGHAREERAGARREGRDAAPELLRRGEVERDDALEVREHGIDHLALLREDEALADDVELGEPLTVNVDDERRRFRRATM